MRTVALVGGVRSAGLLKVLAVDACSPWKLSIREIEHRINSAGKNLPAFDPASLIEARRIVRELCN